ncbi:MAG: heparin lyase I family protein [Hyphomicrobiaceae bacterium]|nr:heparin lyase I family protein [Hyphomicrobiaceae bacterium]
MRVTMVPGNAWKDESSPATERAELDGWKGYLSISTTVWVAWAMYVEPGLRSEAAWCILNQIYQYGGDTNAHVLRSDGKLYWVGKATNDPPGWPVRYSQPLKRGVWLQFVETYKFDPVGGNGHWKSWLDGRQVVNFKGPLGSKRAKAVYPKFGIYRATSQPYDGVEDRRATDRLSVRYANMRFGRQNLSHLIKKPEPLPAWETWP